MALSLNELFGRADFLPDTIDFAEKRLNFVQADRSRVEQLPFIDGREPLGKAGPSVSLADALATEWERPREPDRYIFHVGFCGSTFLATVLQHAGVFALREPRILIDVSDAYEASPTDPAVPQLVYLAADLLRRPWRPDEPVVCKPSNWCNNLIPVLLAPERKARAVFITATPHEYLVAALRGGSGRIENVARTAHHLLGSTPNGLEQWNEVMRSTADPLDRGARLALVALRASLTAFGPHAKSTFTLHELYERPREVVSAVARALQLDTNEAAIEAAIGHVGGAHSKQPDASYSIGERTSLDRKVEEEHGAVIGSALGWAEQALGF